MGKNQSASNLTNIIKQDANGNITFVSGSTTLMSVSSSGAVTTTGNVAGTASYASNAELLDGLDSTVFTLTSSFAAQTASFTAFTASQNILNGTYATTGSNTFAGIQTVNSNLVVTGSITAQTLVVQTITSSVDFVTGSTRFGSILANTHVFSGSITMNPGGLFVSSSGNVGINTTSPSSKLHVVGSSLTDTFRITDASNYTIVMGYSGSANVGMISTLGGTAKLALGTNSAARLTIDGTGNVGIGTTNPGSYLDVIDEDGGQQMARIRNFSVGATGNFTGNYMVELRAARTGGAISGSLLVHAQEADDTRPTMDVSDSNGVFTRFVNGKVGIGTSSPSGLLSLKAFVTDTPTLVFQNSLGGPNSAISNFTSNVQTFTVIGTNIYVNSTANIARFNTNYAGCGITFDEGIMRFNTGTTSITPSVRMTITAEGTLQVSKNTLNSSVQMLSDVSFGSGTTGQIIVNQSNSWYVDKQSDGYYWVMYGMDSAGLGWRWNTYNGSYANRFFFYANGTAYNSSGTWGNSSDIRLKQDIVDANPQWGDIKALKFKKYKLKKDVQAELESTDGYVAPTHFGLIAQEVELTSPGLVEDVADEEGTTKMLKTSIMLMKSVKALQEAMQRIETLETENDTLKEILQRNNIQ